MPETKSVSGRVSDRCVSHLHTRRDGLTSRVPISKSTEKYPAILFRKLLRRLLCVTRSKFDPPINNQAKPTSTYIHTYIQGICTFCIFKLRRLSFFPLHISLIIRGRGETRLNLACERGESCTSSSRNTPRGHNLIIVRSWKRRIPMYSLANSISLVHLI